MRDQLRLNFAVRDYITSEADFEDVASTAQLRHNVMLTAGIGIALGQRRSPIAPDFGGRRLDHATRPAGLGLLTYDDAPEGVSGTQGVLNFTYGISTGR